MLMPTQDRKLWHVTKAVTGPDLDAGRAVRHKRHRIISGGGVDVTKMRARDWVRIIPLLVPPGTHHHTLGLPIRIPSHAHVQIITLIVGMCLIPYWTVGKQHEHSSGMAPFAPSIVLPSTTVELHVPAALESGIHFSTVHTVKGIYWDVAECSLHLEQARPSVSPPICRTAITICSISCHWSTSL